MTSESTPEPQLDPLPRGEALADLFLDSRKWVYRRVDAVTLESDGTTRRAISFDVRVPTRLRITGSAGRIIVPLALIEKGALRKVSTADPAGHPMPVLSAKQNSELVVDLLYSLIPTGWGGRGPAATRIMLRQVASAPGPGGTQQEESRRRAIREVLDDWVESLSVPDDYEAQSDLETLRRLIVGFLDHFLLAVQLKEEFVDTRCVLKFAYERDLQIGGAGTFIAGTDMRLPDIGFAQSQHIEFTVPPGLTIPTLAVLADEQVITDISRSERSTAHVAFQAKRRFSEGDVLVEMKPVAAGIHRFTKLALSAVFLIVALGLLEKWDLVSLVGQTFKIPSQTVSVLLIGPALFLSWMSKSQEHEAVALLLRPLRLVLFWCTVALFALAVAAAVPLAPWSWEAVWVVATFGVSIAVLTYGRYRLNLSKLFDRQLH